MKNFQKQHKWNKTIPNKNSEWFGHTTIDPVCFHTDLMIIQTDFLVVWYSLIYLKNKDKLKLLQFLI